jgi:hypothetical protein
MRWPMLASYYFGAFASKFPQAKRNEARNTQAIFYMTWVSSSPVTSGPSKPRPTMRTFSKSSRHIGKA